MCICLLEGASLQAALHWRSIEEVFSDIMLR